MLLYINHRPFLNYFSPPAAPTGRTRDLFSISNAFTREVNLHSSGSLLSPTNRSVPTPPKWALISSLISSPHSHPFSVIRGLLSFSSEASSPVILSRLKEVVAKNGRRAVLFFSLSRCSFWLPLYLPPPVLLFHLAPLHYRKQTRRQIYTAISFLISSSPFSHFHPSSSTGPPIPLSPYFPFRFPFAAHFFPFPRTIEARRRTSLKMDGALPHAFPSIPFPSLGVSPCLESSLLFFSSFFSFHL